MEELTGNQKEELHKAILALQQDLRMLLSSSAQGAEPVQLDGAMGRLSRMDAMQQQSMVQANRRAAEVRLLQIEGALQRLDSDEYGYCVNCEEEIGFPRLKAKPETPFCLVCQNRKEMVE